ncbi:hypothetical protein HMPREF9123_2704 [Neisseria bacilliformis ATCC BAA-1200]|uniref:Uncharacterized protein n=1 Tax=Neisseria bacilliformis ATCC BAA-1200 TaxID=888742 RepID=F2BG47_9NEIS|nr:hypothetical protein HMPREF9123_2704 [Neisseria bacilliformis ATCC BAA-1200]
MAHCLQAFFQMPPAAYAMVGQDPPYAIRQSKGRLKAQLRRSQNL